MAPSYLAVLGAGLLALGSVNAAAVSSSAGGVCTSTSAKTTTLTVISKTTVKTTVTAKAMTETVYVNGTTTLTSYVNTLPASASNSSVVLSSSTSTPAAVSPTSSKSSSLSKSSSSLKNKRAASSCASTKVVTSTHVSRKTSVQTVKSTITKAGATVTISQAASTTATYTTTAVGPSCTARNDLTDIVTPCENYSGVPYCAVHEGAGIAGQCMSCVPLNDVCTASSQCCDGFACSEHDANDFGFCRPYSPDATGLQKAKRAAAATTSSKKTTSTAKSSTTVKSSTTKAASSTTSTAPQASTTCTLEEVTDGTNTWLYVLYYSGSGYTLSPVNEGNDANAFPPVSTTLASGLSDCQAIAACAQSAVNLPDNYWNFDLHYAKGAWTCVQYINGNDDVGAWNVTNSAVTKAYGFSVHGV